MVLFIVRYYRKHRNVIISKLVRGTLTIVFHLEMDWSKEGDLTIPFYIFIVTQIKIHEYTLSFY